jgi:hypothetical protein
VQGSAAKRYFTLAATKNSERHAAAGLSQHTRELLASTAKKSGGVHKPAAPASFSQSQQKRWSRKPAAQRELFADALNITRGPPANVQVVCSINASLTVTDAKAVVFAEPQQNASFRSCRSRVVVSQTSSIIRAHNSTAKVVVSQNQQHNASFLAIPQQKWGLAKSAA